MESVDGSPADGSWPRRAEAAQEELRRAWVGGVAPGLVAVTGVREVVRGRWYLGATSAVDGQLSAMRPETVFDLASLTKVVAALPCVLHLVARQVVDLDGPVRRYLPRFRDEVITVRHLLTHTAGLPESPPLHRGVHGRSEMADALYSVETVSPAGTRVTYSDVGFALLGLLVEATTRSTLEEVAGEWIFRPLGISARFTPPRSWRRRCAATEVVDGEPVVGRVHDENAAAAGGVSGHAGLFATAPDIATYLQSWTGGPTLLPLGVRLEATRCQTRHIVGSHRGLGWVCRGDGADFLSPAWGPEAVSHTGFTGTSVAIDPVSGRWAVLLTNALHFGRGRDGAVRSMRERFHAALVGDLRVSRQS